MPATLHNLTTGATFTDFWVSNYIEAVDGKYVNQGHGTSVAATAIAKGIVCDGDLSMITRFYRKKCKVNNNLC